MEADAAASPSASPSLFYARSEASAFLKLESARFRAVAPLMEGFAFHRGRFGPVIRDADPSPYVNMFSLPMATVRGRGEIRLFFRSSRLTGILPCKEAIERDADYNYQYADQRNDRRLWIIRQK